MNITDWILTAGGILAVLGILWVIRGMSEQKVVPEQQEPMNWRKVIGIVLLFGGLLTVIGDLSLLLIDDPKTSNWFSKSYFDSYMTITLPLLFAAFLSVLVGGILWQTACEDGDEEEGDDEGDDGNTALLNATTMLSTSTTMLNATTTMINTIH